MPSDVVVAVVVDFEGTGDVAVGDSGDKIVAVVVDYEDTAAAVADCEGIAVVAEDIVASVAIHNSSASLQPHCSCWRLLVLACSPPQCPTASQTACEVQSLLDVLQGERTVSSHLSFLTAGETE